MSGLVGMSIATVVELVIDRIIHSLWAYKPRMTSSPRLLYHSVRGGKLIVLHYLVCYETRPPDYEE
jgi:hypothetical protein